MRVIVTGGAGYIGIHTVLKLLEAGRKAIVYDKTIGLGARDNIFTRHYWQRLGMAQCQSRGVQ
jgi:UDP-glucose 4-epimerase